MARNKKTKKLQSLMEANAFLPPYLYFLSVPELSADQKKSRGVTFISSKNHKTKKMINEKTYKPLSRIY